MLYRKDILLYKSDIFSIIIFISGVLFCSLLLSVIISVLLSKFIKKRERVLSVLEMLAMALLMASTFTVGIDHFTKLLNTPLKFFIFSGIILVLSVFAASRMRMSYKDNLKKLVVYFLVATIFTFPVAKLLNHMFNSANPVVVKDDEKRGVLLLVVDTLGAKYLPFYNSDAKD